MKKKYRIKKNHEIASIVNIRKKVVNKNYIIYFKKTENQVARFAFSVSKKYGKAVERNKAKRIVRSIFRKYLNVYHNIDFVVIIKPSSKKENYDELENEVEFLLDLINKKNSKEEKSEI